ncbi:hypothetical protein B0T16DRAFT_413185 [Cercophora newfieldiana]|uniref:Uncharacterized protein n=1 Tax=Cercophora newfieldiana TaxID=92897 RepID=A0AA39Y5B5_9PEZI|nr:hypothetical protein B0T16DRAFT_413185 [Cercophora newfieldiana]
MQGPPIFAVRFILSTACLSVPSHCLTPCEQTGATKDNLEFRDFPSNCRRLQDIKGPKTLRVYVHIPFLTVLFFDNQLRQDGGDWIYSVEEMETISAPSPGAEVKLIELKKY